MTRMIITALLLNGADLATGFISAIKNKDIQSSKLRDGMFKKVGFICCYVLAAFLDSEGAILGFHFEFPVLPVVVGYVAVTEVVSILENISKINPDLLPEKLMSLFSIKKED